MKKSYFINILKFNHWMYKHHLKLLSYILYKRIRVKYSCDFPPTIAFKNELSLPHFGLGVVIHPKTVIGYNCKIYQGVTIGSRNGTHKSTPPIIGDNVIIGANAVLLGDIRIGNNVIIGAGAVVLNSIPDNCIAVGVPAVIKRKK